MDVASFSGSLKRRKRPEGRFLFDSFYIPLLGAGSYRYLGYSVIVDYHDTNFLVDNPSKPKLLRVVSRQNGDILADRETTNANLDTLPNIARQRTYGFGKSMERPLSTRSAINRSLLSYSSSQRCVFLLDLQDRVSLRFRAHSRVGT